MTAGVLLSIEQVDVPGTVLHPRRPLTFVRGARGQWQIPNAAGHRRMLTVAGFGVDADVRLAEPFGPAHPEPVRAGSPGRRLRTALGSAAQRLAFGGPGIPVQALRARPAPGLH